MPLNGRLVLREPKVDEEAGRPAASRRYRVSFLDWDLHETIVQAASGEEAIAKARAMHDLNGLAEFEITSTHGAAWDAQVFKTGVGLIPAASRQLRNTVVHGDYVAVVRRMESASADFILTDPPYLCRYKPRDWRSRLWAAFYLCRKSATDAVGSRGPV